MKKTEFKALVEEIQLFMWLDNWELNYIIKKMDDLDDNKTPMWQVANIFYDYFKVRIDFNEELLKEKKDYVAEIVFHELAHIYTLSEMKMYQHEMELFISWIWAGSYQFILEKMIFVNEQQTELLARSFKRLYDAKK